MRTLSSWFRIYWMIQLVGDINSYVLLAANADDFRNIARKLVPEPLADSLTKLALGVSEKHKEYTDVSDESDYENESSAQDDIGNNERDFTLEAQVPDLNMKSVVNNKAPKVNFEELVVRVKERLAEELREEMQKLILKRQKETYDNYDRHLQTAQDKTKNGQVAKSYDNYQNSFKLDKDIGSYLNENNPEDRLLAKATNNKKQIVDDNINRDDYEEIDNNRHLKHKINYQHVPSNIRDLQNNYKVERDLENSYSRMKKDGYNDKSNVREEKYSKEKINNKQEDSHTKMKHKNITDKAKPKDTNYKYFDDKYIDDEDTSQKYRENVEYENTFTGRDELPEIDVADSSSLSKQKIKTENELLVSDNTEAYNLFKFVTNKQNDSYEDYEIPKKETNIFESEESVKLSFDRLTKQTTRDYNYKTTKSELKRKPLKMVSAFTNDWNINQDTDKKVPDEYVEVTEKSQEIKAETESLWFNDAQYKDTETVSEKPAESKKTTKRKGTVIPKRDFYKIISPNYYISIPTVAERYDPDEPLPERDRVRQVIKDFVNPPARINKKVKLV